MMDGLARIRERLRGGRSGGSESGMPPAPDDRLRRVLGEAAATRRSGGGSGSAGRDDRLGRVLGDATVARRRRIAELSAVAGVLVVVVAFVGATVAMRRSDTASPDGPGLPAPSEVAAPLTDSPMPSPSLDPEATGAGRSAPGRPGRSGPSLPMPPTSGGVTVTPAPGTTRVSAPAPSVTTPAPPPVTTTPPPSPPETTTPAPTETPTTEPPTVP